MQNIRNLFKLLKANHWIKNLYLFAPLFFSGHFSGADVLTPVLAGLLYFCFASSLIYIINDLIDAEKDRLHPVKRFRPIASGAISKKTALIVLALLIAMLAASAVFFKPTFILIVCIYIVLNIIYTLWLKNVAIIDVSIISTGFVLRVLAGGVLAGVAVSHWLVIMIYLLSMFLALAKRRDDLVLINTNVTDASVRKSVKGYNLEFMQAALVIMATVMIVCYIMYITSAEVKERLHFEYAYFNSFFVIAGVMKYLQIIFIQNKAGSPVKIILSDIFIQACVVLWLLSFFVMLYILK